MVGGLKDIRINNSGFFREIGLKSYQDLSNEFNSKCEQKAANSVKKTVSEGYRLKSGSDSAISEIAKSNTTRKKPKIAVKVIKSRPKISLVSDNSNFVDFII